MYRNEVLYNNLCNNLNEVAIVFVKYSNNFEIPDPKQLLENVEVVPQSFSPTNRKNVPLQHLVHS